MNRTMMKQKATSKCIEDKIMGLLRDQCSQLDKNSLMNINQNNQGVKKLPSVKATLII